MKIKKSFIGTVFVLLSTFSFEGLKASSKTVKEQFKQNLQASLSEVPYNDHEDRVRRRIRLGIATCSGRERFLNGVTGIAEIDVRQEGSSFDDLRLIADISLPYSGSYNAKNFINVGCEYRDDPKSPKGVVKFTVTRTIVSTTLSDVTFEDESHGGHDAGRMSREAIQEDIISPLQRN